MSFTRLQRKLIPFNIIFMLISLVASLSLLFAPIIKVDLSKGIAAIFEMSGLSADADTQANYVLALSEDGIDPDGEDDGNSDGENAGDSEDEGEDEEFEENLEEGFEEEPSSGYDVDISGFINTLRGFSFSITAMDAARLAFAENPTQLLIAGINKMFSQATDRMFINVFIDMVASTGSSTTTIDDAGREEIYNKFENIGNAKTDAEVDIAIQDFAATIAQKGGISDESEVENIESMVREVYDKTVESAGEFSIETAICVMMTKDDEGNVATSYGEMLLGGILDADLSGANRQPSETQQKINKILKYIGLGFFLFILFFALIWFIQALFAFFHIFGRDKRFRMWYTRVFGLIPCILFGIFPLVMQLVFKSVAELAFMATIISMVSTMTWISGGCWLVGLLLSLIWASPIKRKIRKIEKEAKERAAATK